MNDYVINNTKKKVFIQVLVKYFNTIGIYKIIKEDIYIYYFFLLKVHYF